MLQRATPGGSLTEENEAGCNTETRTSTSSISKLPVISMLSVFRISQSTHLGLQ